MNGQTLVNIQNYNVLFHMLLYMSATGDYQRQRLCSQANMYNDSANGSAEKIAHNADEAHRTRHHVVDTWLGFLGTAKPQFIDTSLLGNVRISRAGICKQRICAAIPNFEIIIEAWGGGGLPYSTHASYG